jgi:hypothetical protein
MTEPVRMVNSRGTLESLRHIGITLEEGITELVDNAVDAGANNIGISLHTGGISDERTLVIADDGVGIPESIPGKDLTSTVQHVLRFGGKIPHHGRAIPIGKYGFGLSQTAAGLSLRTDVSSKVEYGQWRTCFYDLEQLRTTRGYLPPEQSQGPNTTLVHERYHNPASGTVVCLHLKSDLEVGEFDDSFVQRMHAKLGRIYRTAIASGLTIHIDVDGKNDSEVNVRDPLAQLPNAVETLMYGKQELYANEVLTFDGQDMKTFPVIEDHVTGAPAQIQVRMVLYDVESVSETLLDEANKDAKKPVTKDKGLLGRAGFNPKNQGFSVVRSGREIKNGQTLGMFAKHDQLNYFKGEVQFPAALDHLFNVQVIKGRYTIEKRLRDVLEARYKSTIAQMKKKTVQQRAARNTRPRPSILPRAESRTQGMRKTIQRRTISPALRQRKLEELTKKKKRIIAEVDTSEDAKVKKAQIALKEASDRGDVQQAKVLKAKMETTEHNAKKAKKDVRRRFENEAFMRKEVRPLANGDLYAIEDYDDEIFVIINSESDFFRSMYSRAAQHGDEQDLLDLMIFAIAYAEADRSNSEEMDQFWQQTRSTVSSLSHIFVSMLNHVDPVDETPASQEEAEEVEEEPESHVQLSLTDSFGGSP